MKLTEVISSNVKAVGYESGNLYVMFNGGAVYEYDNVPQKLYEGIMKADSKGKFINKNVTKSFSYTRLPKETEIELISLETK